MTVGLVNSLHVEFNQYVILIKVKSVVLCFLCPEHDETSVHFL